MTTDFLSDFADWWTADRARTVAACVASLAAIVTASFATASFRQTRRDSKARSRPMVAAMLRAIPYVHGSQQLVIVNCGPSIAKDVRVSFDPEIPEPLDDGQRYVSPFIKKRYAKPIPTLTPGDELDNIYYSGQQGDDGSWVNRENVPEQVTVTIRYKSTDGDSYEDDYELDTNLLRARTYTTSSASPEERLENATMILSRIDKSLAQLAKNSARIEEKKQEQRRVPRVDD